MGKQQKGNFKNIEV